MTLSIDASASVGAGVQERLAWLLSPVAVDEFASRYWEQRPLVVHRSDSEYYAPLITLAQFDQLLSTQGDITKALRVIQRGKEDHLYRWSPIGSAPTLEQCYARYRQGATLSLTHIHHRWPPLGQLCQQLAELLSAGCQTNVYLTPPMAQGLGRHADSHDVLVLQVAGTKRWRVGREAFGEPSADDVLDEFDLTAGDLLYLPRGVVHEAMSLGDTSFHLTIGILPLTYADVLRTELEHVIDTDHDFRRALPIGFHRVQGARRAGTEQLVTLARRFSRSFSTDAPIDNAAEILGGGRQSALAGHLLDLEALRMLDSRLRVRLRTDLRYDVSIADTGNVRITFHGKVVTLPKQCRDAVTSMTTGEVFTADALPGLLDQQSRVVIVKRLLEEGFLTVA
jgi:hypothetical protein